MPQKAPWVTHRPELKVLDCTIRDGGLINDHQFPPELVRATYETCLAAGIDYLEIGYKNSDRIFPRRDFGPLRHCEEEDIRAVVGDHDSRATGLKLAAMADAGKSDWKTQIGPKRDSILDMIRVAFYVNQIPEAVEMLHHCHEMGYETSANLMATSVVQEIEIEQTLEEIAKSPADVIVLVDSFGHFYREQIDHLIHHYLEVARESGKEVGIHAHNNLQLAFANTIEAIILGSNRVDATMAGLGRGAGNCPMELLIGFLRNPRYRMRPILQLLQDHLVPLRQTIEWGPLVPYNITGQLNIHPRWAIQARASSTPDDFVGFYDKVIADI